MNSINKKSILIKKLAWLILFSIAMGYLETAVVVYLREIYYPQGFSFPLTPIDATLATTEFWREVATLIMLLGIGILTGKSAVERLAFFLLSFAIWDIFYYIFLYILLGWPVSLFTWDILFLVPAPWIGPVLSPVIIATLMIILASCLIYFNKTLNRSEWFLAILGSIVVIFSWMQDYYLFYTDKIDDSFWTLTSKHNLFETTEQYIPTTFNWYIFALGAITIYASIISFYFRNKKNNIIMNRILTIQRNSNFRFNQTCFFISMALLIIEILIALFMHDKIIRPYVGDLLVVILIYCFIQSFYKCSVIKLSVGVLLFAYTLEIWQYYNLVDLIGLSSSEFARIVIGSHFEWIDMIMYTLGILCVVFIENNLSK